VERRADKNISDNDNYVSSRVSKIIYCYYLCYTIVILLLFRDSRDTHERLAFARLRSIRTTLSLFPLLARKRYDYLISP